MDSLKAPTEALLAGESLPATTAEAAAEALAAPDIDSALKKAFLEALHAKGESVEEVTAFARVFRRLARDPGLEAFAERGVDIVGTGGSASGGYNVSSASAVTVAACGATVLKHGNRAITSQSGAADFLGQLGLPIQDDPAVLRRSLEELNFCFFFAPAFHPAFKEIMPVRKALAAEGKRSIFNILGPLINPAKPQFQLLGVFSPDWVRPLADSMTELGLEAGLAVHAKLDDGRGMDEFTTCGDNVLAGVGRLKDWKGTFRAEDYGFESAPGADITGASPAENVAAFERLLAGDSPRGLLETIALTAGASLFLVGEADSIAAGATRAKAALLDGTVADWVQRARVFYAEL